MKEIVKRRYGVILANPPFREIDQHYTLKIKQLKLLPIYKWADDNCVLFLLCSFPMLEQGIELVNSWGFTFVSALPWGKTEGEELSLDGQQLDEGIWVTGRSECLLISRRGHTQPSELDYLGLISAEKEGVPEGIYRVAETVPGPYLEVFAEKRRDGWHAWGNGVQSDVNIDIELPVNFLQDQVVLDSSITIKNTWNLAEESKWIIGDAVNDLIKTGLKPQQAYTLALSQMEGVSSETYAYMMAKVARAFRPAERKKMAWHLYYEKYKEINKKSRMLKAEKRRMWRNELRKVPIFREEIERLEKLEQDG